MRIFGGCRKLQKTNGGEDALHSRNREYELEYLSVLNGRTEGNGRCKMRTSFISLYQDTHSIANMTLEHHSRIIRTAYTPPLPVHPSATLSVCLWL
jgi:hypothetical protein